MQELGAIASSSFHIAVGSFSLKVENATGSKSSKIFCSVMLTALSPDAASSTCVVGLLFFNLVCVDIFLLLSALDGFEPSICAVHLVEEKSSDRLIYEKVTAG